jgi:hypothetical protein
MRRLVGVTITDATSIASAWECESATGCCGDIATTTREERLLDIGRQRTAERLNLRQHFLNGGILFESRLDSLFAVRVKLLVQTIHGTG